VFTIKQAAARAGVEPSTLRAWEQRYGVVTPRRSAGGYRVYSEAEVATLRSMAELIDQGWSAAQAAEKVRSSAAAAPVPGVVADEIGTDPEVLVRCATDFDAHLLTSALDQAFARASFETVVAQWLLPGLQALGTAWADGRVTIAGEHFVTAAVQRRLSMSYEAAGNSVVGPVVLIGLPPDSRHELGVLVFATLLRRLGVRTRYVGADLPLDAWADAASAPEVAVVVLAAPMDVDARSVADTVDAIRAAREDLPVLVGGASQDAVTDVAHLGHDMLRAARDLAQRLHGSPQTVA
jgi:MerR family transcriptional regulator, light-induced transcriptional regulator